MSWLRRRRTGTVKRLFDEIDLDILAFIEKKGSVTMTDIKKVSKLSWSNLQIHKKRLEPFINIQRQNDNSKVVTLNEDGKAIIEIFKRVFML